MFLFDLQVSVIQLLSLFGVSILSGYYFYYRYCYTYWKKKGVPTSKPRFPFGDLSSSAWGKQSVYSRLETLYHQFKAKGYKHAGIYFFNGPIYFPIDPDLVKRVLVTDFEYFVDRGMYGNGDELPLSCHIFSMKGEEWKNIRTKMSPSFTAGKMKSIYNIVVHNCENLVKVFQPLAETRTVIDIKDILMRFTADVIGSTSFGIDCNSLDHPDTEFSRMVNRISNHSGWKLLRVALEEGLQNPGNIEKIAYNDKVVEDFFTNLVKETMEYRDKNNIIRNDFLHMLMQLRESAGMSLKEIVSQSFLFFIAGFKTSALTMCYCIHELAHSQDLQDKVREEIHKNLGRDVSKYAYEELIALPTLDKVVKETMRKYPPLPMLNRICVKSYQVPGTDVVIDKDTPVIIPVLGLQRDPEFYPEPLKFDPERFSNDNNIVPYTYLPFGDGPRNCIGLRFGMVKTKLAVAALLNNFRFLASSKTRRNLAIDPSTTSILFNVSEGIYTKIIKV
ncbi:probable cytochrome P450 6a23 [Tribolium castaneum]|uniref:Cytochrome P450 346A1 n=1 Tax=Tribolium castaneum TaxID=7070 RepID=D6WLG4_TRICA|nr:PREDICTED: probable cytochrome P450 6a23 [Tribolium castaneum]EFA04674.1 cytochrome P450 346A1 [Tribolium castaneum]|eukprot:XP_967901.1 PREDICTED: probable cytochrome P450 6a23 [Tribolium castaneum]